MAVLTAILFISFSSCKSKDKTSGSSKDVLAVNLDTLTSARADFFQYANGGWIKENPIPGEQSSWGIGNLVIEENLRRLREIAEKASDSKPEKGSAEQKIGDFWATAMDSTKIEKDGLSPLKSLLDKVNNITDAKSLLTTVAELKKAGSSTLFLILLRRMTRTAR